MFAVMWLLSMPVQVTFEVRESLPNGLQSRPVAGNLRSLTSDQYVLTPNPSGTRLDYVGQVAPGFELFRHIEQAAVEPYIARQFQALANEIEQQGAQTRVHPVNGTK
jgi:hypothetical protein